MKKSFWIIVMKEDGEPINSFGLKKDAEIYIKEKTYLNSGDCAVRKIKIEIGKNWSDTV